MFTGIIEFLGKVESIQTEGTNRTFHIRTPFDEPIRVDQSISHNGVCLTVTEIFDEQEAGVAYAVTAVEETLIKTQLGDWQVGDVVNVERCLKVGARLDGHFVQGHVDGIGTVSHIEEREGSWMIGFEFDLQFQSLMVNRGSICVNGVSLTVANTEANRFEVTIIPFTWEHTQFHQLKAGDRVNLEFDILGKYILKHQALQS
ncbi:riboflavin synthase [Pontibacter sp. G13]|uniref:riboflavin synthase n=1 Tax=Pontibacter sp. G13 TaxID=3074898 RepID=UPI0028893E6E|nr:riboflavin synthase [Pontibacter sp. G13]WNJ17366.1 riboflavin synthase [Pontibacter sp. G13]